MKNVREVAQKPSRPVKILQFGEGNFLRAFVDEMVDQCNEQQLFNGNIQIVKPIASGSLDAFRAQDCIYTVLLRGKTDGGIKTETRIVTSVAGAVDPYTSYAEYAAFARSPDLKIIVSNTTEAGICFDKTDALTLSPPKSFPGKLTKFLYERFQAFDGAADKGVILLPVELIDRNGSALLDCCLRLSALWALPDAFTDWLTNRNLFCNTLVDRIVTGYPENEIDALAAEWGYTDRLLVAGELFGLWVIESDRPETVRAAFPLDNAGLPVLFTKDYAPFRERKVRLLNGAHTAAVFAALLSGVDTVSDAMRDPMLRTYIERVLRDELAPMVPLRQTETLAFADAVTKRFENPYIRHEWRSIALNSVSKFRVRILPTICETYQRDARLPRLLSFSLAAMIDYYEQNHPPDTPESWDTFFAVPGLAETVNNDLAHIREHGMRATIARLLND